MSSGGGLGLLHAFKFRWRFKFTLKLVRKASAIMKRQRSVVHPSRLPRLLPDNENAHVKGYTAAAKLWGSSRLEEWRAAEASLHDRLLLNRHTVLRQNGAANFLRGTAALDRLRAEEWAAKRYVCGAELLALLADLQAALKGKVRITKQNLVRVVMLKHSLMQWRPNLHHVEENSEADVEKASAAALGADGGSICERLKALTALRGVGPATATLVCALAFPEHCAFMTDEVISCLGGEPDGKLPSQKSAKAEVDFFASLVIRLKIKGAKLGNGWTANRVQLALLAAWQAGASAP